MYKYLKRTDRTKDKKKTFLQFFVWLLVIFLDLCMIYLQKKCLHIKEFIQTEDNKLRTIQYIQPVAINLRKMQFFWLF